MENAKKTPKTIITSHLRKKASKNDTINKKVSKTKNTAHFS
jgi:hypothetical protein